MKKSENGLKNQVKSMNQAFKNANYNLIKQDYFEENLDIVRMKIQVNELFNSQNQIDQHDKEDFLKLFSDLNDRKITAKTKRTLKKLQINYV